MSNANIHNRPFKVIEYDHSWPTQYQQYAGTIKGILGDNLTEIHHLGSTSIPGMFAKPNIDIYAAVASFDVLRGSYDKMKAAGFTPRGDYSHIGEEYFTVDHQDGERIASVHIFEGGSQKITDYKLFHDYLISNEVDRNRYIALKRELYDKYKDDYPAYDSGKRTLIDEIKSKAKNWANNS